MPTPLNALRCAVLGGLLFPLITTAQLPAALSAVVVTPQVRAELVAHAPQGLGAGQPVWLGLKIEHQPHWHTYWKNPGDSGLPTTLAWTLPAGAAAGDIEWPAPQRLPIGPLMNYGYEGTLLLPVAVTLPAGGADGGLEVKLRADWLVCKDVCIPEGGDFVIKLPAQTSIASHAALFDAAHAAAPRLVPEARATASVEGGAIQVRVDGLPSAWQGKTLAFFPETAGVINNAAVLQARWQGGQWQAAVPLDAQRSASPATMPTVLRLPQDQGSVIVNLAVSGPWPAVAAPAPYPGLDGATVERPLSAASAVSLSWALLLALAGGALLNLMPCVFPVLSLKMLAVAGKGADRRALLASGVAYTVGVVLSFLMLAGLLLALRAGGEQLGWGFQLQSPVVVAVLAGLFTLIGLNLAGVFELRSVLPGSWLAARARHPIVDSAVTGVLAVAVASPCTAPFMGASLGLAVTLPTGQALSVFAALGLGMALPYLAATAWPPLARALPRPGVWMVHFKTAMAFPMFATVVWLVWVLGQQSGIDGAAALLSLLLALAFAAWGLGSASLGPRARIGFGAASVAVLAAGAAWAVPLLRHETALATGVAVGERWQPWSPERVAQAHSEGRIVFVDFTAAWCVTCQINKRALNDSAVLADFDARGVLLLRADWTRRDATIAAELSRLGRSGVPVYAFYAPGAAAPRVLSEILSTAEIRAALAATQL